MTLSMFKDVSEVGGFNRAFIPTDSERCEISTRHTPVVISEQNNSITFYIQKGPIKEVGMNGCQVDTLVHAALHIVKEFNKKFPCNENGVAIEHLEGAIAAFEQRKKDREARGVEGTSNS
jgi:hypothetical protein